MTERLKKIWSAFEAKTDRRLTGGGVDNIALPPRADDDGADQFLPDDFTPPAQAAFSALKAEILAAGEQNNRRRGKRARANAEFSGEAYDPRTSRSLSGAPEETVEMIRGLNATAARIDRPALDYGQFLAENANAKLNGLKKRKKFLGLF